MISRARKKKIEEFAGYVSRAKEDIDKAEQRLLSLVNPYIDKVQNPDCTCQEILELAEVRQLLLDVMKERIFQTVTDVLSSYGYDGTAVPGALGTLSTDDPGRVHDIKHAAGILQTKKEVYWEAEDRLQKYIRRYVMAPGSVGNDREFLAELIRILPPCIAQYNLIEMYRWESCNDNLNKALATYKMEHKISISSP